jgi:predicted nuclease of predicted toxin-antitoxin system
MNLMRPKLLADIHISPLTVVDLRANGYEINRVSDFISASASDDKIIELAILEKAAIITQDLDFSALVAQSGLNKPSIVSLRVSDAKPHRISTILKTVLPQIEPDLQEGAIVSIEETEYRVRKLPIS